VELASALPAAAAVTGATVRTADLVAGQTVLRLDVPPALSLSQALPAGSVVSVHGGGSGEVRVVASAGADTVTLTEGLASTYAVHDPAAPANIALRAALGVERRLTDLEQGPLNLAGVNVLRVFPGQTQPVVWGARTTAGDLGRNWQYVNVRRLLIFLEQSITAGIRWAVFEPNDLSLWQRLKRTINDFLTAVRSGGTARCSVRPLRRPSTSGSTRSSTRRPLGRWAGS
jgi:Phage tail sheath C-terminal domain